jgi:hypothetical protein
MAAKPLPSRNLLRKTQWDNFEDFYVPEPNCGCWLWTGSLNHRGYGQVRDLDAGKTRLAPRVSYQKAYGLIQAGLHVLHRCDIRCCVNPEHLFLGTPADNTRDMMEKGRHKYPSYKGEAHPMAKLTDIDVRTIRAASEQRPVLAARYGVSPKTIARIQNRRLWRHLP